MTYTHSYCKVRVNDHPLPLDVILFLWRDVDHCSYKRDICDSIDNCELNHYRIWKRVGEWCVCMDYQMLLQAFLVEITDSFFHSDYINQYLIWRYFRLNFKVRIFIANKIIISHLDQIFFKWMKFTSFKPYITKLVYN